MWSCGGQGLAQRAEPPTHHSSAAAPANPSLPQLGKGGVQARGTLCAALPCVSTAGGCWFPPRAATLAKSLSPTGSLLTQLPTPSSVRASLAWQRQLHALVAPPQPPSLPPLPPLPPLPLPLARQPPPLKALAPPLTWQRLLSWLLQGQS